MLASVLVLAAGQVAHALHRESPGAVRITRTSSHEHTAGRNWGNNISFISTADLAFTGNSSPQVFAYNVFNWVCQYGTPEPGNQALCASPPEPELVQVTTGAGNPSHPSIGILSGSCELSERTCDTTSDCQTGGVDLGECILSMQWVAFEADGTLGGATGPSTNFRQIYLMNLVTNELRQVTFGVNGDSRKPSLNSLGGIVVFESTATLTGQPTHGVPQVFVYERKTNLLRQLTFGQGPSTNVSPNDAGSIFAFQSTADLLGGGADTGISQIYWADYDKQSHTATLGRLTDGNADSVNPVISPIEAKIAFETSATNLGGVPGGVTIYRSSSVTKAPIRLVQLTRADNWGNCRYPAVSERATRIAMVCDGDPLVNGTTGNRLFVLEELEVGATLRQITGAGDVPGPISHNLGLWFLSFVTTSDLTGEGSCGAQLYFLNYYDQEPGHWVGASQLGQLPPDVAPNTDPGDISIGRRPLIMQPGDGTIGSHAQITTRDGVTTVPLTGAGAISMVIGPPNQFLSGFSSVNVRASQTHFPPIRVGNLAICLAPAADGTGSLSCNGGQPGGDLLISKDHNTEDTDPSCVLGCRESDMTCQGALIGPHAPFPCPVCVSGFCGVGSTNVGAVCSTNSDCIASAQCLNGFAGVCNGATASSASGTFLAGGLQMTLPLWIDVSQAAGLDGEFCTADDQYGARDVPASLKLNTGTVDGAVLDADNVLGASLVGTATGAPFNCVSLKAGELFGAALVGTLPILDVPNVPGLRDLLLGLRFEPRIEPGVCDATCGSGLDCDDGNACNGTEMCVNGVCVPGVAVVCDDGDPCNGEEVCEPLTGACLPGPPCDDGDPCNGVETCTPLTGCQTGTPIVCDDGDACNGDEACDPGTGGCLPGPLPDCDDGDVCTGIETCDPVLGCVPGTPIVCSDGEPCNGEETCDPLSGVCGPGVAPACDDGNPCTDDSCAPGIGCVFANNSDPCDDGTLCTSGDTCSLGVCTGTPTVCDDGDACNGFEECDAGTGACLTGTAPVCDDGNPCTDDACDPVVGCVYANNANPCDDGSACTSGDTCTVGVCVGTSLACDDGDACNGTETCDPLLGCQPGSPLTCDDGNACTNDICDAVFGCLYSNATGPCDDGSACTSGDSCVAGLCVGVPLVCDDGNACNGVEVCLPLLGCQPGIPAFCDDGNPCTDDSCDPVLGCLHVNNAAACDDGDACTTGDVCQGGVCTSSPTVCDDGNVCNGVESCDPGSGSCVGGTALVCDDGELCTDDSCDPVLGCQFVANTAPCDDGDVCTSADACTAGQCSGTPDLMCAISALEVTVEGASAPDLGGGRRQRKLLRQVLKVRTRAERGLLGDPAKALRQFTKASKAAGRITRRTVKGVNIGKVEPTLGSTIVGLASQIEIALQTLMGVP